MNVGDRVTWTAIASNYGHPRKVPAVVLSVGPKRVRIETRYGDGQRPR